MRYFSTPTGMYNLRRQIWVFKPTNRIIYNKSLFRKYKSSDNDIIHCICINQTIHTFWLNYSLNIYRATWDVRCYVHWYNYFQRTKHMPKKIFNSCSMISLKKKTRENIQQTRRHKWRKAKKRKGKSYFNHKAGYFLQLFSLLLATDSTGWCLLGKYSTTEPYSQLIYLFTFHFEMRSSYVAKAALELVIPPVSGSHSSDKGTCHHSQFLSTILEDLSKRRQIKFY